MNILSANHVLCDMLGKSQTDGTRPLMFSKDDFNH